MSFLSPSLAWFGLAAASIPIIIHLLNRRRFKQIDWAPMKYLKLTVKKNRRRIEIEQLILLLLRILAMLLLFLTVARPMLPGEGLGGWLASNQRRSRVIVVDDSPSMADSLENGGTLFEKAKDTAVEIVRSANSDQLTVFTTSRPDAPLVRQTQLDDPADLVAEILKLKPTSLMNGWSSTLATVEEYFSGAAYPMREAILITDVRAAGWNVEVAKQLESWKSENNSLTIIDVGQPQISNLAIVGLRQVSSVALAGSRLELEVEVANFSDASVSNLQATLFANSQPQTIDLPTLAAESKTKIPLQLDLTEPGQHRIRFELPPDLAIADNDRFLIVDVKPEISIAIVDGDPRAENYASESFFLAAVARSGRAPWRVSVVSDLTDAFANRKPPDVLVLANLASVSSQQAQQLQRFVTAGMGLVIYPGDLIDSSNYNRHLFAGDNGILPARIEESRETEIRGLSIEPVGNSPLTVLGQLAPEVLTRISPKQILFLDGNVADDHVRILARWNNAERSPALLEKRLGRGRVYFWTVTADRGWSDWPQELSFVVACRQVLLNAAMQVTEQENVVAGETLVADFKATQKPVAAKLQGPKLDGLVSLATDTQGSTPKLAFAQTSHAGFYKMTWDESSGSSNSKTFSANSAPQESEPLRMSRDAFSETLGDVNWRLIRSGASDSSSGQRTEIWRRGAMLLLGLVGLESLFAAWVGRER